jgi:plastocyanin
MITTKIKVTLFLPMLVAASLCARAETPSPTPATRTAASPQAATVAIHNFMFSPVSMTVAVGTTVQWKNLDGEPHTVRGVDSSFASGALDQDDTFAFKFDKPGTYRYACSIHPQMVGTIVVNGTAHN